MNSALRGWGTGRGVFVLYSDTDSNNIFVIIRKADKMVNSLFAKHLQRKQILHIIEGTEGSE